MFYSFISSLFLFVLFSFIVISFMGEIASNPGLISPANAHLVLQRALLEAAHIIVLSVSSRRIIVEPFDSFEVR